MNAFVKSSVGLLMALSSSGAELTADNPRISVFVGAIETVARENGISMPEAVHWLRTIGVTGFDANYDNPHLPELVSAGMTPANFYGTVDFLQKKSIARTTDCFLSAATKFGAKQVMVLPPMFSGPSADRDTETEAMLPGFRYFVAEANRRGLVVTIEDYGYADNVCSYSSYIRKILDETPGLCLTADSGNLYCIARRQEDINSLAEHYLGRIRHVHLKDYAHSYVPGDTNETYETLGRGAVSNRRLVEIVSRSGYGGWYTLENPVGPDVFADIARQSVVLKSWLSRAKNR